MHSRMGWRARIAAASVSAVLGCDASGGQRAGPTMDLAADSMGALPNAYRIEVSTRRGLVENSGAAMSVEQPGVWFTINDSGNDAVLFALDTTGADRGAWRIIGALNRDWEALTIGPCMVGDSIVAPGAPPRCLYIGEVGDNGARDRSVIIYRVEEPAAQRRGWTGELRSIALSFVYEGGPRDVEAMYAGPDGTLFLISKRALKDASGRLRPALIFALPPSAWRARGSPATAALVDSLPIIPGTALGRQITDAARAPDGRTVAVRTYTQLYVFRAVPETGRIVTDIPPTICSIAQLEERQGEGITWFGDGGAWMLTSEGVNEPLHVVACPAPNV